MLQVSHIHKQFRRTGEVLRDVSFTLGEGEFLSVIGPSGAGKTTLFRILNGAEPCSSGQVVYDGVRFEGPGAGRSGRSSGGSAPSIRISAWWSRYPSSRMC